MQPKHRTLLPFPFLTLLASALGAQTAAPQYRVVPAPYATTDAISYNWLAGGNADLRQQTLVGPSHLQGLIGHELLAIEFRRNAANEVYQGGAALLTVVLSTSARDPLRCSPRFTDNVGPDAALAYSGTIAWPTSPAIAGPTVPWTSQNTVRIPLQTPFVYQGGTLCIDIVGAPVAGQETGWWMADAEFEDLSGSAVATGNGCGIYGGPQHEWSHVATRTLLPGAHARFFAHGPSNGLAFAMFGASSPFPTPLSAFGIAAPGCDLHLQPGLVLATQFAVFEPEVHPLLRGQNGCADARFWIPDSTWTFGLTLTTQWLDLTQPATSNAITWTVASALPTLDMALVEGVPSEDHGEVTVHLAHVLRFEHR